MWFSLVPAPATHVAHGMHSMRSAEAGFKARAVTDTPSSSDLRSVASANVRGALAMHRRALAMDRGAFAMHRLSILRVRCCVTRPVSSAHDPAKI